VTTVTTQNRFNGHVPSLNSTATMNIAVVEALPRDLIEYRLGAYLSGGDIFSLSRTCKCFAWLATKESVWQSLCVRNNVRRLYKDSWKTTYWVQCAFDDPSIHLRRRSATPRYKDLGSRFLGAIKGIFQPQQPPVFLVNVAGVFFSGVSTLMDRLAKKKRTELLHTMPTIGVVFESITCPDLHVTSWSEGGSDKIRAMYRMRILEAHGFIWVVDRSNLDELKEARESAVVSWMSSSNARSKQELYKNILPDMPHSVPFLLIGNKLDLPGLTAEELADLFGLHGLNRPWRVEMCSWEDISALQRGIEWLRFIDWMHIK
jgi:GTPase SAR1 family protein